MIIASLGLSDIPYIQALTSRHIHPGTRNNNHHQPTPLTVDTLVGDFLIVSKHVPASHPAYFDVVALLYAVAFRVHRSVLRNHYYVMRRPHYVHYCSHIRLYIL